MVTWYQPGLGGADYFGVGQVWEVHGDVVLHLAQTGRGCGMCSESDFSDKYKVKIIQILVCKCTFASLASSLPLLSVEPLLWPLVTLPLQIMLHITHTLWDN